MSFSITMRDRPFICYANDYQFGPGQVLGPRFVQSRMFLWARHGAGHLVVNGSRFRFEPGDWSLLPWYHEVTYEAELEDPLMIGGFHLIPSMKEKRPRLRIFHSDADEGDPWPGRADRSLQGIPQKMVRGRFREGSLLRGLSEYLVRFWQETNPSLEDAEDLARVAVRALREELARGPRVPLPGALNRVVEYARTHLHEPATVEELAALAGVSAPTLTRMFRRCFQVSPKQWWIRQRIERASHLLVTTADPIGRVAERSGFEDVFHFARSFRKHRGMSPSQFRKQSAF